jgi:hypothetical protein
VFNGRLLMRAEMNVGAEANETHAVSAVTGIEKEHAQVLSETLTVQHTVGEGRDQGLIKGTFEISQALQADEALLGSGEARVEDILGGGGAHAGAVGIGRGRGIGIAGAAGEQQDRGQRERRK